MSADHRDEWGDPIDYDPADVAAYYAPSENVFPIAGRGAEHHDDWAPVDLTDPSLEQPPDPPDLHEFIYSGMRHMISGPPEAAKTLVAYDALLRLANKGERVAILDFEMGPKRAALLLRELGASDDDLRQILFIAPETPPRDALEAVISAGPVAVLIDASLGAYLASGLDDNARTDVERFAATWVLPLWRAGIATLVIDHVQKNPDTRHGAIGSERKGGQVDVHIGLAVNEKRALTRGGRATIEATVHKDRPAFLRRPVAYFIDIVSHEDTHQLTLTYRSPEHMPTTAKGGLRPTIKMDQASRYMEKHDGDALSKTEIAKAIGGNREMALTAIDLLVAGGHLAQSDGPRGSHLITFLEPYSKEADPAHYDRPVPTSSDQFPTSSENRSASHTPRPVPTGSSPSRGEPVDGTGRGGEAAAVLTTDSGATSSEAREYELQRLLDKYESELRGAE